MPVIARLRIAVALVIGLLCAAIGPAPALAVTPSPPPGAPAVESAPSSLVGLNPELPPGVIAANAAAGSHWTPEKAIYGTASTNDIQIKGAGGTTIRVNEIYPTTASGAPAKGPFPVLLTMTPYGKGLGGSTSAGSAASPGGSSATGGPDNYLAQRGYIEVVEDVRGTGDSNGSWGLFDPVQQQDAIKVLNWAAPAATFRRPGRHLRPVLSGHRSAVAGGSGRAALATEGDLPDGERERHLPGHVVHGRATRL